MSMTRKTDLRVKEILDNNKSHVETYYVVDELLRTLGRFRVWKLPLEAYSGWSAAVERLDDVSRKYHEKMYEASKIQGQGET
jgi:hypothetical protein